MSNSFQIKSIRDRVDDEIRSRAGDFLDQMIEQMGDDDFAPDELVLGDWVLITHWIDPADPNGNHYHRLSSAGLSPHARVGLIGQFAVE